LLFAPSLIVILTFCAYASFSTKTRSVSWAEQQVKRKRTLRSDPLYGAQWHLHDYNQDVGVKAEAAWNAGVLGAGVTIAIVDDGLQSSHPDLQANFVGAHSWDFNGNHGNNPGPSSVDAHGTEGYLHFCPIGLVSNPLWRQVPRVPVYAVECATITFVALEFVPNVAWRDYVSLQMPFLM
jgi:hypothetical protein